MALVVTNCYCVDNSTSGRPELPAPNSYTTLPELIIANTLQCQKSSMKISAPNLKYLNKLPVATDLACFGFNQQSGAVRDRS